MKNLLLGLLVIAQHLGFAQEEMSLDECYVLLENNYPLAKQQNLLKAQNELDLYVVNTQRLPQLNLEAQATYQSDVVSIPIPNTGIEAINNDQYKATFTVNQLIYGAGIVKASSQSVRAGFKSQQKQLEVNIYQLKQEINQLYFSILLVQEKIKLFESKQRALETKWVEAKSAVENGAVIPGSQKLIELELLKLKQRQIQLKENKSKETATLCTLLGIKTNKYLKLKKPILSSRIDSTLSRPELELFQLKQNQVESTERLISKSTKPKLAAFATGGYGNPGLNFLDNSFQPYYILGVKLKWTVFDWNSNKKTRESLLMKKEIIENEKETFELQTRIKLEGQISEIEKFTAFIQSDKDIIKLREELVKTYESQYKNGLITLGTVLGELTNLYEDKSNLRTHEIELLLFQANYNITKGS